MGTLPTTTDLTLPNSYAANLVEYAEQAEGALWQRLHNEGR